ncbi:MAG TPA: DUF4838 domain-containing protein [Phycisphaerae bacterium]|nr:DUF4838 domain-containing protein [Phycisphaerae bacterium]
MHSALPMGLIGCLLAVAGVAVAAAPITLVDDGKPVATIVIADDPTAIPVGKGAAKGKPPTVAYAAEELRRFIEKATGARLEIVPAAKAPATGTLLLVGRSALSEQYKLALPTRPEGLRIIAFPRGVAILGEVKPAGAGNIPHEVDRGALHGVYEFLERIVGYRFFIHIPKDPDLGIATPVVKTLAVATDYKLELAPDFPYRGVAFETWSDPVNWMRVTREGTGTGSGTGFPGINHTDRWFGKRFFGDNPDWAAMIRSDGTRSRDYICYSQPGVLAARVQVTQDVYDGKGGWFGEHCHPGPKWIGFEPMDLWDIKGLCVCDLCKPQYQLERGRFGRNSNLIFRHGVAYAAEIAKRWPDKRLGMLAYEGHMLPPDFDLPENLDVQVCMMWSTTMGKEPYWHERNLQLMRDWSRKLGGKRERLYVWNFYCYPAYFTTAPIFFPHNLQKWLQDTYAISGGEMVCPGGSPPQYEIVMAWLWHRLMWDRNADVDALLHDQCTTFFGPAGRTMEKLYTTVIERYENVKWSQRFDETYVPPDQMYGETYTPEVISTLKKLFEEALAACPQDETDLYRRRVAWMRKGFEPFFADADQAHQWLGKTPSHKVVTVAVAPADAAAWAALPAVTLVQGNFGRTPDLATRVRIARCGDDLLVRFEAEEPMGPMLPDRLALIVKPGDEERSLAAKVEARPAWIPLGLLRQDPQRSLTVNGEGMLDGTLRPELVSRTYAAGVWTVVVKCPAAAFGIVAGQAKTVEVQFERYRAARGKQRASDYYWMAPMRAVWLAHFRFGRLQVEGG